MEEFARLSNDELLKMSETLTINHEKIKNEIIQLHEILKVVERDWLNVTEELKNRK